MVTHGVLQEKCSAHSQHVDTRAEEVQKHFQDSLWELTSLQVTERKGTVCFQLWQTTFRMAAQETYSTQSP